MRIRNREHVCHRRRLRSLLGVAAIGLAGAAVAQPQGTTTPTSGSAAPGPTAATQSGEPAWLLVPIELSTRSQEFTQGCWVRLYSGDNFGGRLMTVVGPANLAEVRSPYGTGLNNWESAEVGPNATVTTYDDQNFRARSATLRPGQRYAELDDSKLGLFEDIESMRVTCTSPTNAAGGSGGTSSAATTPTAERTPGAAAASSSQERGAAGSASTTEAVKPDAGSPAAATGRAGGSSATDEGTPAAGQRDSATSPAGSGAAATRDDATPGNASGSTTPSSTPAEGATDSPATPPGTDR